MSEKKWSSSFGFIMASVGAAVGLGNIWGFPYRLGMGGGFVFLLFYIILVLLAGYPLLLAELGLGRSASLPPVKAYASLGPGWGAVGAAGQLACFIILSYYSFFGGKVLQYLFSCAGINIASSLLWQFVFTVLSVSAVLAGVRRGVEAVCRVTVPGLIVMLAYIFASTASLPSSKDAMLFLFRPEPGSISLKNLSSALTQMLFSLSVGQGCMITFGAYMPKGVSLPRCAALIPLLDTLVALLAAAAIMPAVFASGVDPASGPELLFLAAEGMFAPFRASRALSAVFFASVFLAALSSAAAMLENLVCEVEARGRLKRRGAALVLALSCFAAGVPVCLSFAKGDGGVFELYERVSQYGLICCGSAASCFAVTRVWGKRASVRAIFGRDCAAGRVWLFLLKFVVPPLLACAVISIFLF